MSIVYHAEWPSGLEIIFRPLTLKEYRLYAPIYDGDGELALRLYELTKITGPKPEYLPAGIGFNIASLLLDSPYSNQVEKVRPVLNKCREEVSASYIETVVGVLAHTFRMSFSEIEDLPPEIFFKRVAQAEVVLGNKLELYTTDELEKMQKEAEKPQRGKGSQAQSGVQTDSMSFEKGQKINIPPHMLKRGPNSPKR